MKVSTSKPFKIIYSLFQHEYLGYLFESFAVQVDDLGKLTLQHQNISAQNAKEFSKGLSDSDYELIALMDEMQQESLIYHFMKERMKPRVFFEKVYNNLKPDLALQHEINTYLEKRRRKILDRIDGKLLFEMGNDGEPTWRTIRIASKKADIKFFFNKDSEGTVYYPKIYYKENKLRFYKNNSYIVCKSPAWLVCDGKLYAFNQPLDGSKLQPFLKKKEIQIPKKVEDTYYEKFVAPMVTSFDVKANGFDIVTEKFTPKPKLTLSELASNKQTSLDLFGTADECSNGHEEADKILMELTFQYGSHNVKAHKDSATSVHLEKNNGSYIIHKFERDILIEDEIKRLLSSTDLDLRNSKITLDKSKAIDWLNTNRQLLLDHNFRIKQKNPGGKKFFMGHARISVEIRENIDWFDIDAIVEFGDYKIPFKTLRKIILKKGSEIELPNGEIAIIPESWLSEYSDLFSFSSETQNNGKEHITLKKHHLALVQELESGNLAQITMDRKLQKLRNFDEIDENAMPSEFSGKLRPYQKAGFNWMHFLHKYRFGGCLADDMGLGKTVQTLAMIQSMKENGEKVPSLLVMPTSLVYNWELEARKFTPNLKVFLYTGTNREKNVENFMNYDLVLTSYGIIRLDVDLLKDFYFNYIILDESQAIKNPGSNISKAVKSLNSKNKLILTGTPLENSTLDLWSQMSFINPGLLGTQSFFKNEFLLPIEKKQDKEKTEKLFRIIKPFILRRHKSQVATELPDKVENVKYCSMTTLQEEYYEEVKNSFRNKILGEIEKFGVKKSHMMLLQGLTKLRQIANHPKMVDKEYMGDSGKLESIIRAITSAINGNHKVLVFSQFVKHLTVVKDYLDSNGIKYAYLDGSTKNRQEQVENFQNKEKLKLFLISLKAGGLGLNLTKAEYVFILDPWWNPAIEAQAVDRAHRIGQKNQVFTYKFITKGTVEEKILTLQQRKLKLAQDLIITEESFVKDLSKDDIELLLT